MASMINSVVIAGNLCRDPELRSTGSGYSVCSLRIANNRRRKSGDEWVDAPNFFDVTVWGRQGENCAKYLSKGRTVLVKGELRWREWEGDHGKRQAVDINADEVQFVGGGGDRDDGRSGGGYTMPDSDVPIDTGDFQRVASPSGGADDEDIPFKWRPVEFEDRYEHGSRRTPHVV